MTGDDALVIFLHGVGASGQDLAPLGTTWRRSLPHTAFAAADAPFRFDQGSGRQWFSISGITAASRPQRIQAARPDFDRTVRAIIDHHGLSGRLHRVALVGFSQGSIMALDALVSGRWPVGAMVAFAGRLSSPKPWVPAKATPTLLVHGENDGIIPSSESVQALTILKDLGVSVEGRILTGVDHAISPEGALIAERFLAKTIGQSEPTHAYIIT